MKRLAFSLVMLILLVGVAFTGCPDGSGGNGSGDGPTSPSPASFFVSNLTIEPAEVGPGEAVEITVTVANNGGNQGSHDVKLLIEQGLESTQSVPLASGESETVSFSVIREVPGTYGVNIGNLSGSFLVKQKAKIAFDSDRDGDLEIYVMNADGTNVVQLTDNPAGDINPSWSPDGSRIAFDSDRDGDWEIYVMNADGTNVVQLTDNTAFDTTPDW